jgi:hypothetical protein
MVIQRKNSNKKNLTEVRQHNEKKEISEKKDKQKHKDE